MTPREKSLERFKKQANKSDKDVKQSEQVTQDIKQDDSEIASIIAENKRLKKIVERTRKMQEQQSSIDNEEKVSKIVSNDIAEDKFVKDYHYSANGKKHTFTVRMRPTFASDQNELAQRVVDMTDGKANYYDSVQNELITAIALFQTVGEGMPETLTDPQKISRTDLVFEIYQDYLEWLRRFQDSQSI